MKKNFYKLCLCVVATSLTLSSFGQTLLYPTAEKCYRTATDGVLGTAWNSGYPKDTTANEAMEIRYTARIYTMQQYAIPDIANVASISITFTRQSGQSNNTDIGAWLYPDSDWSTAAYADFVENIKTIMGVYPGSTSSDSTLALANAALGISDAATTNAAGLQQRTITFSTSALEAIKATAEVSSGVGTVNFALTTANLFVQTNYKFYSSILANGDNRPTMTVTYGAVQPDPVVNHNTGVGYSTLSEALTAATGGDTLIVNEDQEVSVRLNVAKAVTIMAGEDGATISRATSYTNGIMFLAQAGANLVLDGSNGALVIDGANVNCSAVLLEASNGQTTLNNVTVKNAISTNNQGIICNKTSGKLLLNNVTFSNCTVNEGFGTVFAGTNNVTLSGNNQFVDCNGIYIENYSLKTAILTNTTPISITLKDPATRTVTNVVLDCTDTNKFTLTNSGYQLASDGTNLIFTVSSATAMAESISDQLTISTFNGQLLINTVDVQDIAIYAIDGRCIRRVQLQEGTNVISLPQGIYLIGNHKVIL